jgi:hypothetical protein
MTEKETTSRFYLQTLIIPVVLAVCTYFIQGAIQQKEINGRILELAIEILSEKPTKEKVTIRTWAVEVVNRYSEVSLDERMQSMLIYNATFMNPASPWRDDDILHDDDIFSKPYFVEPKQGE